MLTDEQLDSIKDDSLSLWNKDPNMKVESLISYVLAKVAISEYKNPKESGNNEKPQLADYFTFFDSNNNLLELRDILGNILCLIDRNVLGTIFVDSATNIQTILPTATTSNTLTGTYTGGAAVGTIAPWKPLLPVDDSDTD